MNNLLKSTWLVTVGCNSNIFEHLEEFEETDFKQNYGKYRDSKCVGMKVKTFFTFAPFSCITVS